MENKKLVLIDGNSIFYRAFFALPLLSSEHGYSNAVYGFANILLKAIQILSPTHMAVAFDVSKKTFRNEIFPDYKATRKPMPTELASQIEPLKEMLRLMGIKVVEKLGLEGDDILGTLAKKCDVPVVIVTGDKDCFQLIDERIKICRTIKGVSEVALMGEAEFESEFAMKPIQLIDFKGLSGDSSDNIPGVSGVGPKTATDLISEFGSIEEIYENLDKIHGKLNEKLQNGREMAFVSKKLATINCDVDIDCSIESMKFVFPFSNQLRPFFEKFQMRSLLKRTDIWAEMSESLQIKEKQVVSEKEIKTFANLIEFVEQAKKEKEFAFFATEDGGEIQLCCGKENFKFVSSQSILSNLLSGQFFEQIKPVFEEKSIKKIFFDTKDSMHFLKSFGISVEGEFFDVALAKHLVDGNTIRGIKDVLNSLELSDETIAHSLFISKKLLIDEMKKVDVKKLFDDVEIPLVRVLFDMEITGFPVDKNRMKELNKKYAQEIDEISKQIFLMTGTEFNLNSPKQLSEVLFDKMNLPHDKKKSTGVDLLKAIEHSHAVVPLILRYRTIAKLMSTYIEGLEKHLDEKNVIHTRFKQTLTTTGRLSSTEPNLQNIPIRTQESREIRSMFVARSNEHVLIDADYSQIELRLMAHYSKEPSLVDAFLTKKDIHTETACKIFGVSSDKITPEMRRAAKIVNFGILYGMSDFGLSNELGTTPKVAKQFIDNYFREHPKVKEYMNSVVENARKNGRVSTILGRTRRMLDIAAPNYLVRSRAERASQNAPLQGSAADIIKVAMIRVFDCLEKHGLKAKLIMQVHDELVLDCPKNEEQIVCQIVKEEMEKAVKLEVPLVVDITTSFRWSEGH